MWADKKEPESTIKIGLLVAALCVIVIPFIRDFALVVAAILAGMGVGTVWTNTDTLMSNLAKEGKLGATMGAAGSFKELGDMLGPILIGILSQFLGLTAGFVICGILGVLSFFFIGKGHKS
jgi:MFS family permease